MSKVFLPSSNSIDKQDEKIKYTTPAAFSKKKDFTDEELSKEASQLVW